MTSESRRAQAIAKLRATDTKQARAALLRSLILTQPISHAACTVAWFARGVNPPRRPYAV